MPARRLFLFLSLSAIIGILLHRYFIFWQPLHEPDCIGFFKILTTTLRSLTTFSHHFRYNRLCEKET
uniref:Uncharacterized protein n=1 Tax=Faecalibaculum rodentium TaxID=1702221 RepID=A0A140DWA8_9FIRM|nr:hypothetical protein AALO17_18010 [Faecalibaculum rodentium]